MYRCYTVLLSISLTACVPIDAPLDAHAAEDAAPEPGRDAGPAPERTDGAVADDAGTRTDSSVPANPGLLALPDDVIDEAIDAPLGWFGVNSSGEQFCSSCEGASIVLAVASYSGVERADARLLEQIRHVIGGGRDPFGDGGYMAQHERLMTGMIAIAKRTPRVWSQLDADEVARADLVMRGTLVGSAYTTADTTNAGGAPTTLTGSTNANRGWNPNFREGMVGAMIVSTLYFGGREATEGNLNDFDHSSFVEALNDAGLTHMHDVFTGTGPSGAEIEAGIRNYRYLGHHLGELPDIFVGLTTNTFGGTVECGYDGVGVALSNGERSGILVSGCDGLPNLGAAGQLLEFHSSDANGPRASATYALDGFRPNLINHVVLLVYDALPPTAEVGAAVERARVGAEDLLYKVTQGYRSYAKGADRGIFRLDDGHGRGMEYCYPLFTAVANAHAAD